MGNCFTVEEATVGVLESWGKYSGIATPGFHCVAIGTGIGKTISLKLRQSTLDVRTRTKDNVFVKCQINVQWAAIQDQTDLKSVELGGKEQAHFSSGDSASSDENSDQFELQEFDVSKMKKEDFFYAAAYSVRDPELVIKSVVEEFFRIVINKHKMDKLFDLGTSITSECSRIVNQTMVEYGYCLKKVVIKDIEPVGRIRSAMNNIVASQKERESAITRAEAEKTARIKAAEAAAEVARLQGEGIAKQRYAICEGLKHSVEEFSAATRTDTKAVMSLLMMTQHTDMVRESLAHASQVTLVLKSTPTSAVALESDIRDALIHGDLVIEGNTPTVVEMDDSTTMSLSLGKDKPSTSSKSKKGKDTEKLLKENTK